jgi:hypothetical protein
MPIALNVLANCRHKVRPVHRASIIDNLPRINQRRKVEADFSMSGVRRNRTNRTRELRPGSAGESLPAEGVCKKALR